MNVTVELHFDHPTADHTGCYMVYVDGQPSYELGQFDTLVECEAALRKALGLDDFWGRS